MKCAVFGAKTLVVVAIAVAVTGAIGCGKESRKEQGRDVCISNLKQIQAAVEMARMAGTYDGTAQSIVGEDKYIRQSPVCPAGGTYKYPAKDGAEDPSCSVEGHAITVAVSESTECGKDSRKEKKREACISNLKQIQAAVEMARMAGTYDGTAQSIVGKDKYIRQSPVCPAGGTYKYPAKDGVENPSCSVEGHAIPAL